jgi:GntR family transcriptional regulator, transcriptional repressor for pyruvate dehydrogenase complex
MAVTDEAILKIKGMILSGELKPGDRLSPEKELSESLGLSRSSLREAVKALEIIRVLDVRRGDGTYVTSLEPQLLLEAMAFVVDIHQDSSVLELFEVRRILERYPSGPEMLPRTRHSTGKVSLAVCAPERPRGSGPVTQSPSLRAVTQWRTAAPGSSRVHRSWCHA